MILISFLSGVLYFKKYDTSDYVHKGFFPLPKLKPIYERKIIPNQILKIGLITDTHVRPRRVNREDRRESAERRLSTKEMSVFNEFTEKMGQFNPTLIIHLGDVIEGTHDPVFLGMTGLRLVKKALTKNKVPIYWVLGNHDLRSVNRDQFKKALEIDYLNKSFDYGDYRLIFLDANYKGSGGEEKIYSGMIPKETLDWLKKELTTEKQTLIFLHQAVFKQPLPAEGGRQKVSIGNVEEVRKIFAKYRVKAVFNGHIEVRHFEEDKGVRYYSLTGTKKSKTYPGSFYELTVDKGVPQLKMFYADEYGGKKYQEVNFEDKNTFLKLKD